MFWIGLIVGLIIGLFLGANVALVVYGIISSSDRKLKEGKK
jgi:uncharacterized membrane-anchored protein YhcB (DUF1043 family)